MFNGVLVRARASGACARARVCMTTGDDAQHDCMEQLSSGEHERAIEGGSAR